MSEKEGKVLIIGGGGREHALAIKYAASPHVKEVYVAPGNTFMHHGCETPVRCFPHIKPTDVNAILNLCREFQPTLVDVAQDNAVESGVVNRVTEEGLPVIGPTREAGRLEWDKAYARDMMKRCGIPHPRYALHLSLKSGRAAIESMPEDDSVVIKTRWLAEGKGVVIAHNKTAALAGLNFITQLPDGAGMDFLLEELVGGPEAEEFSGYFIGDGRHFHEIGYAQDAKRRDNNDEGPNTGGMGVVSKVSFIDKALAKRIQNSIIEPTREGLISAGTPYKGILYLGGMYNPVTSELWVIEYNSRWGDPEAQSLLPGLQNDLYELSTQAAEGDLQGVKISLDNKVRVVVAGVSLGYPGDYSRVKNRPIEGLSKVLARREVQVLGAGIIEADGRFLASGGRLFYVVAAADTVEDARRKAYAAMSETHIKGDKPGESLLHYRTDIGLKEAQRQNFSL